MNEVRYLQVGDEEDGQRLDNFLIRILKGVPKSHIYRIIRSGEIRINKKRADPSTRIVAGDSIRLPPIRHAADKAIKVTASFERRLRECIIYEDDVLLVINKPSGIAVHGGSGISLGVIEALRKTRVDLSYLELVHRLDRETSGCLLLAKKRSFLRAVQALFETRYVEKTYWAILARAWIGPQSQWVDAPLQKNTLKSGERVVIVSEQGKAAKTEFKLLENYEKACWVEIYPQTGRTHQIRVHSVCLGHPILGDEKYGQKNDLYFEGNLKTRLYLHARAIQFNLNGKRYYFQAELDQQFTETLNQLRVGSMSTYG